MLKRNHVLNALVVLIALLVIAGIITMVSTHCIVSMYVWIVTFIVSMVTLDYYHKES